jgi:hypothetical protein
MKRGTHFFGAFERKSKIPRIQCHVDGISIPGVGSMRLSNLPNNLCKMGNLLVSLGQKASSILFYGFTLGAISVRGNNSLEPTCREPAGWIGKWYNLYLNYSQQPNAFLLIKYESDINPKFPNECNFLVAEKQPGDYIFSGCACFSNDASSYGVFLYEQGLAMEPINCIENNLRCSMSSFAIMVTVITVGTIIGGGLFCCLCYHYGPAVYQRFRDLNPRHEEIPLLINSERKRELLNPVFIDDEDQDAHQDQLKQPPQNSNWFCFRR